MVRNYTVPQWKATDLKVTSSIDIQAQGYLTLPSANLPLPANLEMAVFDTDSISFGLFAVCCTTRGF